MHEWIKLHTALRDSAVYQDPAAKVVFFHLLLIADENGKGRISRFKTSLELRMKPSTFSGALKRCQQSYLLCDIKTNKLYTIFSLNNWGKYQSLGDNETDIKPTVDRQQTDNKPTLYKEKKENKKRIYSSLKDLTDSEFEEIAQEYSISVTTVSKKYSDLVNYCQSKGKKYKNYLATLRAWISKDLEAGKLHKVVSFAAPTLPEISAEEQAKVRSLMSEAREKIGRSA